MSEPYWDGYDGPIYTGTDELPAHEIERQDLLDNITHNYLYQIAIDLGISEDDEMFDFDINSVMAVHDVARRVLFENHGIRIPYAAIDDKEAQAS